MQEIELKFQIPVAARAAVSAALVRGQVKRVRLQAHYFDTPDGLLAQRRMALRLRKEGDQWVQTLKGQGDHPMERWEDNQVVPATRGTPVPPLDPLRHAGTPVGERLMALLTDSPTPRSLYETYRTGIDRVQRVIRVEGARIELAMDVGRIEAADRRHEVCELEFELLSGSPRALLAAARRWVARHGLMLDTRSKAEMGERLLADPAVPVKAVKARAVSWPRRSSLAAAWHASLQSCLAQVLPNASELACGQGHGEHVHQLRVGLRRLRAAIRLFREVSLPDIDDALQARIKALFQQLGSARDADVLAAQWAPVFQAAGLAMAGTATNRTPTEEPAPSLSLEDLPPPEQRAAQWLRQADATGLWLDLMGALYPPLSPEARRSPALEPPADTAPDRAPAWVPAAAEPAETDPSSSPASLAVDRSPEVALAKGPLRQTLRRWWRQIRREAARFDQLDDDARHDLRKRVKRLRYALGFAEPVVPARSVRQILSVLEPLQTVLGTWADMNLATKALDRDATLTPAQRYLLKGWMLGREPAVLAECRQACSGVTRAKDWGRAWR